MWQGRRLTAFPPLLLHLQQLLHSLIHAHEAGWVVGQLACPGKGIVVGLPHLDVCREGKGREGGRARTGGRPVKQGKGRDAKASSCTEVSHIEWQRTTPSPPGVRACHAITLRWHVAVTLVISGLSLACLGVLQRIVSLGSTNATIRDCPWRVQCCFNDSRAMAERNLYRAYLPI